MKVAEYQHPEALATMEWRPRTSMIRRFVFWSCSVEREC